MLAVACSVCVPNVLEDEVNTMDANRFDAVTRSLGLSSQRRVLAAVAGIAGAGLGAVIPWRGVFDAEAKKKRKKKKKKKGTCKGANCTCLAVGTACPTSCGAYGACAECCTGFCGFTQETVLACCPELGTRCPSACEPGTFCEGCCGRFCNGGGFCL